MKRRTFIGAIAGGIIITLLTGIVENVSLLGATNYGYPLAWLTRLIIAPEYFPWRIHLIRLIVDLVFWCIIVWVVLYVLMRGKK